jgi:hypothetical protein
MEVRISHRDMGCQAFCSSGLFRGSGSGAWLLVLLSSIASLLRHCRERRRFSGTHPRSIGIRQAVRGGRRRPTLLRPRSDASAEIDSFGIATQERFRKNDKLRSAIGGCWQCTATDDMVRAVLKTQEPAWTTATVVRIWLSIPIPENENPV